MAIWHEDQNSFARHLSHLQLASSTSKNTCQKCSDGIIWIMRVGFLTTVDSLPSSAILSFWLGSELGSTLRVTCFTAGFFFQSSCLSCVSHVCDFFSCHFSTLIFSLDIFSHRLQLFLYRTKVVGTGQNLKNKPDCLENGRKLCSHRLLNFLFFLFILILFLCPLQVNRNDWTGTEGQLVLDWMLGSCVVGHKWRNIWKLLFPRRV